MLANGCVFQARHGYERPGWFSDPSQEILPYDYYGAYADDDAALRGLGDAKLSIPKHEAYPYEDRVDGDLTFEWGASFASVARECRAARTEAVVFDQSYFGKFLVEGPNAEKFLDFVCGAGSPKKTNRVQYTPLCNDDGGVEADLTVTRLRDDLFYVVSGGSTATRDLAWLRKHLPLERGVEIKDVSDERTVLSVQGPKARHIVASLVDDATDNNALGSSTFTPGTTKIMPFSSALEGVSLCGVKDIRILRLTFVGELGFELHVPSDGATRVLQALRAKGAVDAGYRTMDSLSADKGYRHWHADLSNAETPFEANIGFTLQKRLVKQRDADFLGGPALLGLVDDGALFARKRLICLTTPADAEQPFHSHAPASQRPLHGTETIWYDDKCLGFVRSTAFSHTLRQNVSYGYIHAAQQPFLQKTAPHTVHLADDDWLAKGTWSIGDRGTRHPATLHLQAPFDPTNTKVKTISY